MAKAIGVEHVWHIREFIHEDMGADFDFGTSWSYNFVRKKTSFVIYNSAAVKEKFSVFLGGLPSEVVYNGWLPEKKDAPKSMKPARRILSPDMPIKLCIVGSLSRGKRQHEIIRTLPLLRHKYPQIRLDIVGDGSQDYIDELKELCVEYGLSNSVFWPGYVDNVSEIFKHFDISIVCSRNEAFGRVVVESMAAGCPVVAANSGGIPEIITHGKNGIMYTSGDHDELAQQITKLITDKELYSRVVKNGIVDSYDRFSRKTLGNNIYRILSQLVEK